jgi:hypothetical protein
MLPYQKYTDSPLVSRAGILVRLRKCLQLCPAEKNTTPLYLIDGLINYKTITFDLKINWKRFFTSDINL